MLALLLIRLMPLFCVYIRVLHNNHHLTEYQTKLRPWDTIFVHSIRPVVPTFAISIHSSIYFYDELRFTVILSIYTVLGSNIYIYIDTHTEYKFYSVCKALLAPLPFHPCPFYVSIYELYSTIFTFMSIKLIRRLPLWIYILATGEVHLLLNTEKHATT